MEDIFKLFGVLMTLMLAGLIGYAGVTAIGAMRRRLGQTQTPGLSPDELDAIRSHMEEAEETRHRLAEVEERLDFAERLLARQQEPPRIGEGEGRRRGDDPIPPADQSSQ